jgi:Uma2 family endonuclease
MADAWWSRIMTHAQLDEPRPPAAGRPPRRRRLDVEVYYRMAEAGILSPDDRVELIDGEIIDMAPIGSPHAGSVNRIAWAFAEPFRLRKAIVSVQNPLRLDAHNEPQPDVMLLRPRPDDYVLAHPTAEDVLLLVEVAESSLAYDRATKLPLYARHAIREVWIVDLVGRAVEVHGHPVAGRFTTERRQIAGALAPAGLPDCPVDLDQLFG